MTRLPQQSPDERDCLCIFLSFGLFLLPAYTINIYMARCSLIVLKVSLNTNKPNLALFLVKSRPTGANPWPISTVVRGFYTPNNHPALVFYIWGDLLHRLRSYCWETMSVIYPVILCAPCRKKLCVRLKTDWCLFNGLDVLYHNAQFGEDRRTGTRLGLRIWCLYVFCLCHTAVHWPAVHSRRHIWSSIVSWFRGRFWFFFHVFILEVIALSEALESSYFHH